MNGQRRDHRDTWIGRIQFGLRNALAGCAIWVLCVGVESNATALGPTAPLKEAQFGIVRDEPSVPLLPTAVPHAVHVALAAADTSVSWDSRLPEASPFDLPVLYLHLGREATPEADRTLTVRISGISGGTQVDLEIVSRHENRATWQHHQEAGRFVLPDRPCTGADPCVVEWTLDAATVLSDLYRLVLRDDRGHLLWESPDPDRPDLVVLDVWETGVADHVVRVTYATLFPFARGEKHLYHRLTPDAVPDFIEHQFVPMVIETWHTQFDAWGFGPIHPNWDADKVVEIFITCPPFALFDGTGTYTASTNDDGSPYPERRIWFLSSHNTSQAYDSLENGYRVILSHEFYHMVQWNVLLSSGCPTRKWGNVFLEAQAKAAPSIQYPELELSADHLVAGISDYSGSAQRFLSLRMNASYADMEADPDATYDVALYWRFLYEQFGDVGVLRAALQEMACRPVADIPGSLDEVMDAALARQDGAIKTFEQSMVAFAQANYALRLEDGRCATAGSACNGRYYDPHGLYTAPPLEAALEHSGSPLAYDGALAASFGTDLIEVSLSPDLQGQPMTVTFRSEGAQFSVQAWALQGRSGGDRMGERAVTLDPVPLSGDCSATCRYVIPGLDLAQVDRLALIIVRLDPNERADPVGAYRLEVDSAQ